MSTDTTILRILRRRFICTSRGCSCAANSHIFCNIGLLLVAALLISIVVYLMATPTPNFPAPLQTCQQMEARVVDDIRQVKDFLAKAAVFVERLDHPNDTTGKNPTTPRGLMVGIPPILQEEYCFEKEENVAGFIFCFFLFGPLWMYIWHVGIVRGSQHVDRETDHFHLRAIHRSWRKHAADRVDQWRMQNYDCGNEENGGVQKAERTAMAANSVAIPLDWMGDSLKQAIAIATSTNDAATGVKDETEEQFFGNYSVREPGAGTAEVERMLTSTVNFDHYNAGNDQEGKIEAESDAGTTSTSTTQQFNDNTTTTVCQLPTNSREGSAGCNCVYTYNHLYCDLVFLLATCLLAYLSTQTWKLQPFPSFFHQCSQIQQHQLHAAEGWMSLSREDFQEIKGSIRNASAAIDRLQVAYDPIASSESRSCVSWWMQLGVLWVSTLMAIFFYFLVFCSRWLQWKNYGMVWSVRGSKNQYFYSESEHTESLYI